MRSRFCIVLAGAVLLSGCLSPEEQAKIEQDRYVRDTERCVGLGAKTDDQMFQCRMMLHREQAAIDAENAARWNAAVQQITNPPRRPAPTTTNCHTFMNTITCNTM